MLFVIADTHFFDENIIKFEGRPFKDSIQMNEIIINNWNNAVSKNDEVVVAGDMFSSNATEDEIRSVVSRLNGRISLVRGNHDTDKIVDVLKKLGVTVYEYPILVDNFFIVSHEPIYMNIGSPYANVYGHVHSNPNYKDVSPRGRCVSVERIIYTPILFDTVKKSIQDAARDTRI